MSESITLSRDQLAPIEIHRSGDGCWHTPEIYANVRKLGLHPSVAASTIEALLKPEMAERCGVPESCVTLHSQISWVDPNGRLVFWLSAHKPRIAEPAAVDDVIDLPSSQRRILNPQRPAHLEIDRQ